MVRGRVEERGDEGAFMDKETKNEYFSFVRLLFM